jgi:hypothetical protein
MSGIPVGGAAQAPAVTLEDSVYVAALTTSTASPWKLVMSTATGTYDAASARQLVCVLPDCPGRDRTLVAHFVSVAGQRRTLAPFVRAAVAGTWVAPESLPPHRRRLGRLPDPEPRDAADSAMVRGWEAFWRRYGGSAEVLEVSRVGFSADRSQALFIASRLASPGEAPSLSIWSLRRVGDRWHVVGILSMRE